MGRKRRKTRYFTPEKKAEIRRKYYGAGLPDPVVPFLAGEYGTGFSHAPRRSRIRSFASANRRHPTQAEKALERILLNLNKGALRNRFHTQHVISGKSIVDFFFPEIRLAIEVDGDIHQTRAQIDRDREKAKECKEFDITLLRIQNSDVFGNREMLINKLRRGWREALQHQNTIIGKQYLDARK